MYLHGGVDGVLDGVLTVFIGVAAVVIVTI